LIIAPINSRTGKNAQNILNIEYLIVACQPEKNLMNPSTLEKPK
jgi:hypothetical protein